jgi:hypothetical protein
MSSTVLMDWAGRACRRLEPLDALRTFPAAIKANHYGRAARQALFASVYASKMGLTPTTSVTPVFQRVVREEFHAKNQRPEYCAHQRRGSSED